MRKITITVIVAVSMIVTTPAVYAMEKIPLSLIDIGQLTLDTQISALSGDDHMNLIWWIPCEFWQATFARDKTTSESDKNQIINTVRPYSLLVICQADISDFGSFNFITKVKLRANLTLPLNLKMEARLSFHSLRRLTRTYN